MLHRVLPLTMVLGLVLWSCEDTKEKDLSPSLSIQNPTENSVVSGSVSINVLTEDKDGIWKVDFYIDNEFIISDSSSPYEYVWNTVLFSDSVHSIKVISWDLNENQTEKEINVTSDNKSLRFYKTFGENGSRDLGLSGQETTDGGYIVLGYTDSYGNGGRDIWLIKTDSEGNEEWNKTFGGSGSEWGTSVQQTTDGGFIILGSTNSIGNGDYDYWLIKTDSQGNEEWNKTFGGNGDDRAYSVYQTNDGGYILTGMRTSSETEDSVSLDVWLIKTDSQGNEEWNKTFGGSGSEWGTSVQQTTDGGFIITGNTGSNTWLVKTNSQGDEEWNKTFGGSGFKRVGFQTTDGGFIIMGSTNTTTNSIGNGEYDYLLIKTDSNGNEEWHKTYGGSQYDFGRYVDETMDGGFVIVGSSEFFENDYEVWLIKTDSEGNEEWDKKYGGNGLQGGESIQQTTDGGYVIIGYTTELLSEQSSDLLIIKTDPYGNTVDPEE